MGRIDQQVKIRGYRIELAEIENQLSCFGQVKDAVVMVEGENSESRFLCAYLTPAELKVEEIREYLAGRLPGYMIPARFVMMDKLPLTPSGKIDRKKLLSYKVTSVSRGDVEALPDTNMEKLTADLWKEILQLDTVGVHDNFFEIGGNSITILKMQGKLKKALGKDIPVVKLFKYPTIHTLGAYLDEVKGEGNTSDYDNRLEFAEDISRGKEILKERVDGGKTGNGTDVAIIGMAGVFPGAVTLRDYWENLVNGVESITFFTDEEMMEAGVAMEVLKNPGFIKARGILEDVECFDAAFFGTVPREAMIMDPQTRIFHQCVWAALEDAGYDPSSYERRIGLYAGSSPNLNWELLTMLHGRTSGVGHFQVGQLRDKDFMCTRISYKLNLKGPSVSIQTACSTSLVAVHLAVQGLLNGECEMALAGGVTALYPHKSGYFYQEGMISSPDGHCRAFDADSKGVVGGSGAGVIVLKRYEEAVLDRDNIYVVIKGSAINNDGTRKVGYTAPSVEGQAEVIRAAQCMAGIDPETIRYVEAHGTGTELGDPVEMEALKLAFNSKNIGYCGIGSVKTNIGHADTAAGIAGLIKTVLAMKYRLIPATLHFKKANPKLGLENSPFYVVAKPMEWKTGGYPMRAGVSSLGIGGTNAHVVLEEAPARRNGDGGEKKETRRYRLVLLSARSSGVLEKMNGNLVSYLQENPGISFPDVAYTLQVGRKQFAYRQMAVCTNANDAVELLGSPGPRKAIAAFCRESARRPVVFMFPGQGAQYVDMGRGLYETESVFRSEMDRCFEILKPLIKEDIKEILYPVGSQTDGGEEKIQRTEITQPVIFAIEYALARLLIKWGINPTAMIGHSIGEYVAACTAGVFSLEDALRLVVARGKLMQGLPPGAMLGVGASEETLKPLLASYPGISLAAVNSTSLCTVSGAREAVYVFGEEMVKKGYKVRPLLTSHAFHSALMDPILNEFETVVKSTRLMKPRLPYISNLSGTWIAGEEAVDPGYWARHLRRTVQFSRGLGIVLKEEGTVLIEVGPGRTLGAFAKGHNDKKPHQQVVYVIRHPQEKIPDDCFLFNALGELWLYGVKIDWAGFYEGEERYRVSLPTYPFEKKRYILDNSPLKKMLAMLSGSPAEDSPSPGMNLFTDTAPGIEHVQELEEEFGRVYEPPRDELEENIVKIWQDMLGLERISVSDNFFNLNGDSLMATQLITRIKEIYPVEISIKEFFEEPTVARLAEVVRRLLVERVKELSEDQLKKLAGE